MRRNSLQGCKSFKNVLEEMESASSCAELGDDSSCYRLSSLSVPYPADPGPVVNSARWLDCVLLTWGKELTVQGVGLFLPDPGKEINGPVGGNVSY